MKKLRLYFRLLRLFGVVLLGTLLASWIELNERLRHRDLLPQRQRLTRWFLARLANALPFRVRVEGELPQQPMLWVANHVSWSDIPLLGALTPLSFLSKAEVRDWPVAGWLANKAGTLFIRRGSGDSSQVNQQLAAHLQQERHLLIFPEGTRTPHGSTLGPLQRGAAGAPASPSLAVMARSSSHATHMPEGGRRAVQTGQVEREVDIPTG